MSIQEFNCYGGTVRTVYWAPRWLIAWINLKSEGHVISRKKPASSFFFIYLTRLGLFICIKTFSVTKHIWNIELQYVLKSIWIIRYGFIFGCVEHLRRIDMNCFVCPSVRPFVRPCVLPHNTHKCLLISHFVLVGLEPNR